jgi:hypothetical protein
MGAMTVLNNTLAMARDDLQQSKKLRPFPREVERARALILKLMNSDFWILLSGMQSPKTRPAINNRAHASLGHLIH